MEFLQVTKAAPKKISAARMAKFLKANTKLVGRNEIKEHVRNMGISLNVGELEDIFYRMLELTSDESGDDTKKEPIAPSASVKTEPNSELQVIYSANNLTNYFNNNLRIQFKN